VTIFEKDATELDSRQ